MDIKSLQNYLKSNDPFLYNITKSKLNNPAEALNYVVKHYQWYFKTQNIENLDFFNNFEQPYLEIFKYCLEADETLRAQFFNIFTQGIETCYDRSDDSWDYYMLQERLVGSKLKLPFDYLSMYALQAATYNIIRNYLIDTEIDSLKGIPKEQLINLYDYLLIDQLFYEEMKSMAVKQQKFIEKYYY